MDDRPALFAGRIRPRVLSPFGRFGPAALFGGPMTDPLVCIVILHWFNTTETLACIRSLDALEYRTFRVVVVDNGSDAAGAASLSSANSPWDYHRSPTNLGYAGGCNVGLRHGTAVGARYVWFLNSDALVTADTLTRLVAAAEASPRAALVAPLVRTAPDSDDINLICGRFDRKLLVLHYVFSLPPQPAATGDLVLMGAALLARTDAMNAVGGFDEALFAYWEDIDLSLRCIDAGFTVALEAEAVVYHPRKEFFDPAQPVRPHVYYYLARNEVLLLRKHGTGRRLAKALLWAFAQRLDMLIRSRWNPEGYHAMLAGMWDGWLGRTGPWQPDRAMPWLLRRPLMAWPVLIRRLLP